MIDLKPACRQMIDVLAGVGDEQHANRTPCAEYTVRDLIAHVDEVSSGFAALAHGESGEGGDVDPATEPAAPDVSPDWRESVTKNVRALGDAWDDPAAWHGRTVAAGVELANELWGKIAFTEMVVHGWDIAKATGQPFDLPQATLQACFDHVAGFVPNAPVEGLWGPAVEVPADAPLLDRVVAVTGRHP
ncbi:TIGR03086 family metal-binding protein [Streptomyces sp. A5-4]|uniref:TIGR03086 family metal-binding protein n=1 Tax=Streptomyces sp. A5-4 TaxID=3384771 RepID=UPI003DA88652